ncbi:hypothetical protein ElyMa_002370500 [Elysia marginata]|uniref:Uncharacterized protein n=1 Tax=Elysia marginata TaxID=1093978 RepID=A0AAV4GDK1_9GAST|nr:hypothetical protein ElyMa_002370500 [Elysia marginata]
MSATSLRSATPDHVPNKPTSKLRLLIDEGNSLDLGFNVVLTLAAALPEINFEVVSETTLGTIESVLSDCDVRSACVHHALSHYPDTRPTRLNTESLMPDNRRISCSHKFKVLGLIRSQIETQASRSLSENLTTRPQSRCKVSSLDHIIGFFGSNKVDWRFYIIDLSR